MPDDFDSEDAIRINDEDGDTGSDGDICDHCDCPRPHHENGTGACTCGRCHHFEEVC